MKTVTFIGIAYAGTLLLLLQIGACKKTDNPTISSTTATDSPSVASKPFTQVEYTGTTELSAARQNLVAAGAGNKIVFAGGFSLLSYFSTVDIYDVVSGTWTNTQLSEPRENLAAAAAGDKILFGGGYSDMGQLRSSVRRGKTLQRLPLAAKYFLQVATTPKPIPLLWTFMIHLPIHGQLHSLACQEPFWLLHLQEPRYCLPEAPTQQPIPCTPRLIFLIYLPIHGLPRI